MAETVTGTTVGDVKYVVAYLDVNTNNLYDANGQLYGNNTLATFLDNEFTLELHYVQDISTSSNPEEWAVWDGLKDLTVSSTLAFDDNYLHAVKGTIVADTEAGSPSVSVDVTDDINKDTLSRYGVLLVNPFGDEEDQLMIPYSSFQQVSGTTFSFIVDDAQGLEASVTKDTPVRVSDPLYMFINANDIYEANIPNRYEEGVFKFPVNVMSRKLLNALDYSGSTGVSGTMEHKIYTNKTNVVGLKNKSFTPPMPLNRNQDIDEVASLREFAGIKTTIGGDTVYPRDASHDRTNDGTDYYAWMNTENDTVAFYTKTTNVTVGTLLYDELYFTQLDETVSALVYEVNPYLFCGWNSGILKYWTKGNDVKENDYFYNISGGTATVGTASASPVYEAEPVLFRTFAFPFIVRNLVDYGVSLTIPTEDIDWTKEYIISIIRNNMEEVTGKASQGAYGVVMIANDGTIDVNDGVISIATSLATKQDNLTFAVPLNDSGNTVSLQYGDGLAVGVTGTTNANKLITNNATVEEILTDSRKVTVEETTTTVTSITDRVVEPHDLKGALSVGQAVDVSCAATYSNFEVKPEGEENWTIITNAKYKDNFLKSVKLRKTDITSSSARNTFGFASGSYGFPKVAPNLKYLFIVDVKNTGTNAISSLSFVGAGTADDYRIPGVNVSLPVDARPGGQTKYTRLACISDDTGYAALWLYASAGVEFEIANWRQYEVTALTDEAIAYLAKLEDPDAYFRNSDMYSKTAVPPRPAISDKYLIKQDMVCPFIPTIEMENKNLTVAAGLSYKMQYTSPTPTTCEITADTIPTNGYGWDTHLQLFIDANTSVVFKSPLVLMNPLTVNSGNNMTIKWRNGQALAYVDDTDVGYIITLNSGIEDGSFYYALNNDVGKYVVFSKTTDDTPIANINSGSITHEVNIIGNGIDKTELNGLNIDRSNNTSISFTNLTISGTTAYRSLKAPTYSDGTVMQFNNVRFSGNKTSSIAAYQQDARFNNCIVDATNEMEIFTIAGVTYITGGTFSNLRPFGSRANYNGKLYIKNVLVNTTGIDNQTLGDGNNWVITVEGSTFTNTQGSYRKTTSEGGGLVLKGTNIWNMKSDYDSRYYDPTNLARPIDTFIVQNSVLDFSNNTNNRVFDNYQIAVCTTDNPTTAVVGGTAYVIPYGGGEPVPVFGKGTTLLNNGRLGYLVTNASNTDASGTLYDSIYVTGSTYTNFIFDIALNGQTVYSNPNVTVAPIPNSRNINIIGNGIDTTIVKTLGVSNSAGGDVLVKDLTVLFQGSYYFHTSGGGSSGLGASYLIFENVKFTGEYQRGAKAGYIESYEAYYFKNVIFDNITAPSSGERWLIGIIRYGGSARKACTMSHCTFGPNISVGMKALKMGYVSNYQNGLVMYMDNCSFLCPTATIEVGQTIRMEETNKINTTITGISGFGGHIMLEPNSILDLSDNENSVVISGATITVDPTAKVIPYGGTEPQAITGSGNTLSNLGVLS